MSSSYPPTQIAKLLDLSPMQLTVDNSVSTVCSHSDLFSVSFLGQQSVGRSQSDQYDPGVRSRSVHVS